MKKIIIGALLCASFSAFAGCKESDLYGRWFLLSVDKNETITRCHLTINKNGLVSGVKSQCVIRGLNSEDGGFAENKDMDSKVSLAGCYLVGNMIVHDNEFTFDAMINPAKNLISGVIFGKTRSLVVMNRE